MGVPVVVVGASLGGLDALRALLSGLSKEFRPVLAVVLHRGRAVDDVLVSLLGAATSLPVSEPNDKEPIEPGHVYVAPVDYHLLVDRGHFVLSTDPVVHHFRPSIDVLFESAAEAYGRDVVGVILTGANQDGAQGCLRIKELGGAVLAQDPQDAVSPITPAAAIAATNVDRVLPLSKLPSALEEICQEIGKSA
jgi:two-component system chemotaxis response regulator CheB